MTHLRIQQSDSAIEQVSSAVIAKLYELASSGNLDQSSNLVGRLSTNATYQQYIDALHTAYPDLYISATNTYMIFEDPEVENKLKNYVGDGTGVIASRFQAMTQLPNGYMVNSDWVNLFINDTSLTSFNELVQATSCTTLGNSAFEGCTNLQQINISNITSVGTDCFQNCRNCTFNGTLNNLQSIGHQAFQNCQQLTGSLTLNLTSLGDSAFERSAISSITINGSITSIPNYAFSNCTNLASVTLPNSITSIGTAAFENCSSLSSAIVIPNTVTYIGSRAFQQCRNISSITFQTGGSENLRFDGELWDGPFEGTYSVSKIIFPENLTILTNGSLNIANDETKIFVFTSVTPPSVGNQAAYALGVGQNGHTIYVPDASVTAYQDALGSNLSNKIYPVSQMPI